jgi:hypothetical protein
MYIYQPADDEWVTDLKTWIQDNPLNFQTLPGFEYIPISKETDPDRKLARIMSFINGQTKPKNIVVPPTIKQLRKKINILLSDNTKENGYPHGDAIRGLRLELKKLLKK